MTDSRQIRFETTPLKQCTVFIALPWAGANVVSLRGLPDKVAVRGVRERLELQAGLPCHTYDLALTNQECLKDSDILHFGNNIHDGAILRVQLRTDWHQLYAQVLSQNKTNITKCLAKLTNQTQDGDGGRIKDGHNDFNFVALYQATYHGSFSLCKDLFHKDPGSAGLRTVYGRSLLHLAAYRDHMPILAFYLEEGLDASCRDNLGQSPLDLTRESGACTCERLLRRHLLHMKKFYETEENSHDMSKYKQQRPVSDKTERSSNKYADTLCLSSEGYYSISSQKEHINSAKDSQNKHGDQLPEQTLNLKKRIRSGHAHCTSRKPFIARRQVLPSEGRKLVTVEYTPLKTPDNSQTGKNLTSRPQSMTSTRSRSSKKYANTSNAVENMRSMGINEDEIQRIIQRGNGCVDDRKPRAHSAKSYYQTKYHLSAKEEVEYRTRPATATSRFRFWKTWLLDQQKENTQQTTSAEKLHEKNLSNKIAFDKWLSRKRREEKKREEDALSSESEDEGYIPEYNIDPYQEWLDRKRDDFKKLNKKREEELKGKESNKPEERPQVYDRRVTIFEMTSTEPYPIKIESPSKYMKSFHKWKDRKQRYEAWKERNNIEVEDSDRKHWSREEIDAMRRTLYLQGMTYEEWLGLKEKEQLVSM